MELKTAIEILEYHQESRLGKREDMIYESKKLTEALDIVLSEVKKLTQIEDLPTLTLKQAIQKAKPNLDKINNVDEFLEGIR